MTFLKSRIYSPLNIYLLHAPYIIVEMKGTLFVLLAALLIFVAIWFLVGVIVSMGVEQVNYTLMEELGDDVEIRHYDESTLISVDADDSNSAFRILFNYISGKNEQSKKISMTAPVISQQDGDIMHMSFILPKDHDSENTPAPMEEGVIVHDVGPRKIATVKFYGYVTNSKIESYRAILEAKLSENGLKPKGDIFMMRYNPPWIPPMIMKNELAVEIE